MVKGRGLFIIRLQYNFNLILMMRDFLKLNGTNDIKFHFTILYTGSIHFPFKELLINNI